MRVQKFTVKKNLHRHTFFNKIQISVQISLIILFIPSIHKIIFIDNKKRGREGKKHDFTIHSSIFITSFLKSPVARFSRASCDVSSKNFPTRIPCRNPRIDTAFPPNDT